MSEPASVHRRDADADSALRSIPCAVLTVSDTRTRENDHSGDRIATLLDAAGHEVMHREIVPDEPAVIRETIESWLDLPEIRVVLTTGGTGIGRRDTTIDVVRDLFTAELDGFGELFRMLSYEQVGSAALLSRATAGLATRDAAAGGDTFVFAMPGSVDAVETAMTKLVVPELRHLVGERRR